MIRKTKKNEPELLMPPTTHIAVADFLKSVNADASPRRIDALQLLAICAVHGHTYSCDDSDSDASGSDYSDSSDSDSSDSDSSDSSADDRRNESNQIAGSGQVYLVERGKPDAPVQRLHHRETLRDICNMISIESGSIDIGLDLVADVLAAQTLFSGIGQIAIGRFVREKEDAKLLGAASKSQWSSTLKEMCNRFCELSESVYTFRQEGVKKPARITVYPLWLVESMFVLKDRQRVGRHVVPQSRS